MDDRQRRQARPETRLDGEELGQARGLGEGPKTGLAALARFVLTRVYGDDAASTTVKYAHVVFDNDTQVFSDGTTVCGAYQDPPGICRECTDLEWSLAAQAARKVGGTP
ncbi:MAG TPA: hypothetical protein VF640_03905 [Acidimicrobiales bacterium]